SADISDVAVAVRSGTGSGRTSVGVGGGVIATAGRWAAIHWSSNSTARACSIARSCARRAWGAWTRKRRVSPELAASSPPRVRAASRATNGSQYRALLPDGTATTGVGGEDPSGISTPGGGPDPSRTSSSQSLSSKLSGSSVMVLPSLLQDRRPAGREARRHRLRASPPQPGPLFRKRTANPCTFPEALPSGPESDEHPRARRRSSLGSDSDGYLRTDNASLGSEG